jgi:hypothetical protein
MADNDLDVNKLVQDVLAQMKPIIGAHWDKVQTYAKSEAEKLGVTLAKIQAQKVTGAISEQQANILFDMQKNASLAVLAAVHGIGEEAAAKALNAALKALKEPINKAIGFPLL